VKLSLKPPFVSTLVILVLASIFPLLSQENGAAIPLAQSPYRVGERLTYNVSYSSFPDAAHVELEVVSRGVHFGREAIQLRGHLETTGVINVALLAINNDYVTYIDPGTGLPFRAEETARDAIRTASSVDDFNQPAGNEALPPPQKAVQGTYDFISAFYRARALPLAQGAVYNLSVRGQATEYQAELRVVGKQIVRTNVGSFQTIVTQIKLNSSTIKNIKAYFTDDPGRVPVLVTASVSKGDLRVELAGSELITPPDSTPTPTPAIVVAPAPTPTPPKGLDENLPFAVGEQLNYQVFISGGTTPLGIATFQVRGRSKYFDRDGVFLTVNAHTTGAAGRLFNATDIIDSYVDPKGLLPYRTVMNLSEGQRRLNETLTLNQETGTATSDKGGRIEMPVGTHDYLSFFYALRTLNLNPTKKSVLSMLVERKPKTLFVDAIKRESIQLGDRKIPAIALSITTDDPQPDKYKLRMWVSDDRRRLPLRFTCDTKLGALRADLAILPTTNQ